MRSPVQWLTCSESSADRQADINADAIQMHARPESAARGTLVSVGCAGHGGQGPTLALTAMQLLEQLKDERRRLVGLGEDGYSGLLQDLGADKLAHAACDVGVGDAAVRRRSILRGNRNRT